MSNSATALKEAVEFEKKALEKYEEAAALVKHPETKESIEKIAKKNRLQIVFDKSYEPILLYTNPIHDYTDYVLEDLGLNKKNN